MTPAAPLPQQQQRQWPPHKSILDDLISHYSQPIHSTSQSQQEDPPYFDHATTTTTTTGEEESVGSPVARAQLAALLRLDASSSFLVVEWIGCYYPSILRPGLLNEDTSLSFVSVFYQYEWVVGKWCESLQEEGDDDDDDDLEQQQQILSFMNEVLPILASDLSRFSSMKEQTLPHYHRTNLLLPTTLRIIHHILRLSMVFLPPRRNKDENTSFLQTIRTCIVPLLALEGSSQQQQPPLSPPIMAPFVYNPPQSLTEVCACPLPTLNAAKQMELLEQLSLKGGMQQEAKDELGLDVSSWNDTRSGILDRMIHVVWRDIEELLWLADESSSSLSNNQSTVGVTTSVEMVLPNNNDSTETTTTTTTDNSKCADNERKKKVILGAVGWSDMAKAIRSHFFGHDLYPYEPQKPKPLSSKPQLMLGRRKVVTKGEDERSRDEKPYKTIPSRVNTALQFIRRLDRTVVENDDDGVMINSLLPICLALIDATEKKLVALGASALLRLLQHCGNRSKSTTSSSSSFDQHSHVIVTTLRSAFNTFSNASVRALIGQTEAKVYDLLHDAKKFRRTATREWLVALGPMAASVSQKCYVGDTIISAVIPLLKQHALLTENKADSMELCRLGLSALLPIISSSGQEMDARTRLAALIALINLLIGSYPVLHHHRGKLECNLVAASASCSKDDLVYALCVEACVILSTILSTNKTTKVEQSILQGVTTSNGYLPEAVDFAEEVNQVKARGLAYYYS